ncbi:MAG: TolC family protein, partial [Candidatus Saganbacteria bacterium]|nr:TolC family protein [Candidatus Saganbacteria bacterium]
DLTLEAKNVLSDHYKQVEVAYNAGLLKRQDILKVELELSVIEQNSIKAEHAFELSKLTFNTILKSRQRVVYDIQDEDFKAYTSYPDMADEAVMQEANKSRIDLKKFTVAKKMALDYKSLLTGEYFPDVALLANYGWERLDYKEFDVDTRNHMIALGLSWTLFNGFETGAKIKKAEADLRQAYASENLLTKKIELEVKEAMLNLRDSVRRIDNSRKSAALADENLRIALKRYNAGVGTSADVVYAQRDLIQAKQELLEAKFDFEITKAKINKITDKDIL